ncbi:MAG: hypothetical protein SGARI_006936 [Bacillariaceae sp.]
MIENCPKKDEFPMEIVAAKTKQAWSSLLFSETQSDCTIVFKTGEKSGKKMTLHAHRNILAASSPYFKRYFEGAADGSWGGDVGVFETTNSMDVMKSVLSYMYVGELPTKEELAESAVDLLDVANQYEMQELAEYAASIIEQALCLDNVTEVFLDLKLACGAFIHASASHAMFDDRVLALRDEQPDLWKDLQGFVAKAAGGRK